MHRPAKEHSRDGQTTRSSDKARKGSPTGGEGARLGQHRNSHVWPLELQDSTDSVVLSP